MCIQSYIYIYVCVSGPNMRVCVYVCVCIYVYMYVCMDGCMDVCMYSNYRLLSRKASYSMLKALI